MQDNYQKSISEIMARVADSTWTEQYHEAARTQIPVILARAFSAAWNPDRGHLDLSEFSERTQHEMALFFGFEIGEHGVATSLAESARWGPHEAESLNLLLGTWNALALAPEMLAVMEKLAMSSGTPVRAVTLLAFIARHTEVQIPAVKSAFPGALIEVPVHAAISLSVNGSASVDQRLFVDLRHFPVDDPTVRLVCFGIGSRELGAPDHLYAAMPDGTRRLLDETGVHVRYDPPKPVLEPEMADFLQSLTQEQFDVLVQGGAPYTPAFQAGRASDEEKHPW